MRPRLPTLTVYAPDGTELQVRPVIDPTIKHPDDDPDNQPYKIKITEVIQLLAVLCHQEAKTNGWYTDIETGLPKERDTRDFLLNTVQELSEAWMDVRKGGTLMDDHLPNRKMFDAEMADTLIRVLDYCGYKELPIGEVMVEKIMYNRHREDHKPENRLKEGGKKV